MEVSCGLNLAYTAVLTPTDGRTCRGLRALEQKLFLEKALIFFRVGFRAK